MNSARKQRLKEALAWYPEQNFTADSHIVKGYRQRFSVDKICAMRELVIQGYLRWRELRLSRNPPPGIAVSYDYPPEIGIILFSASVVSLHL